jgi:hypothetical protein
MSKEEKVYELNLDGKIFKLEIEVFNLIVNTSKERDLGMFYLTEILKAQEHFSNDADLGGWIRKLVNEIKSNSNTTE